MAVQAQKRGRSPDPRVGRAAVVSTDPDLAPAFCRRGIPALIAPSTPQSDPHPCARRCRRPRVASKPRAADASTPPRRCRKGVGRGGSIGGVPTNQSVPRDLDRDVLRQPRTASLSCSPCGRPCEGSNRLARGHRQRPPSAQMRFELVSWAHIRRGDSARRLPSRQRRPVFRNAGRCLVSLPQVETAARRFRLASR
jgi:hypothetical protein